MVEREWVKRERVDFGVAFVHFVSCAFLYAFSGYWDDHAGALLFGMEAVTIAFHLMYAICLWNNWSWGPQKNEPNLFKWLEYRCDRRDLARSFERRRACRHPAAFLRRLAPLRLRGPMEIRASRFRRSSCWLGAGVAGRVPEPDP